MHTPEQRLKLEAQQLVWLKTKRAMMHLVLASAAFLSAQIVMIATGKEEFTAALSTAFGLLLFVWLWYHANKQIRHIASELSL